MYADSIDGVDGAKGGVPVVADSEELAPQTLKEVVDEQDEEARRYAGEFLKKIIRLRGVRVEREDFLRQELRKLGLGDDSINAALSATPVQAGVNLEQLDRLAEAAIGFETQKSAAVSFVAGLPGGFAMLATVPADVTQYYIHAFRVMQKLAYIYGWQDLLGDLDDADDETVGRLALFLGVMMGVGGAASSLSMFAKQIARPAIQKQIAKQALTKTVWYPVVKKTLAVVGVKVTKDSFAKTVTKVVPVAGGVISGGMTFVALKGQSARLRKHLRELPPPGVDAAEYRSALESASAKTHDGGALPGALGGAAARAKGVAGELSDGAKGAADAAAAGVRGMASGLLRRGFGRDDN